MDLNDKCTSWGWTLRNGPDDVIGFLNGTAPYTNARVTGVKISAVKNGNTYDFYVFYQNDSSSPALKGWGWKLATSKEDAWAFLNKQGAYKKVAVTDARICGQVKGNSAEIFIFYRSVSGAPSPGWGWTWGTKDSIPKFLCNGNNLPVKRAEIVPVIGSNGTDFIIFYQNGSYPQSPGMWASVTATSPQTVMGTLNRQGNSYPSPIRDAKIVISYKAGTATEFLVYLPPVFLIITRPLFVSSLPGYITWKSEGGYEVCLVTAEWIDAHQGGSDILHKIRNCIRHYVSTSGLKFALLIGDSVDTASPAGLPPPPDLSEAWNLPAGYYHRVTADDYQYTTLFYSDQTNQTDVDQLYQGEYPVATGVIPARTPDQLANVLFKTMNVPHPTRDLSFINSADLMSPAAAQRISEITELAGPGLTVSTSVFDSSAPSSDVYTALFGKQGTIYESGHGNLGIFVIGGTTITLADAEKFQFINPLFIGESCVIQAYHMGECLDEAFLKSPKGPAVIFTGALFGSKYPPGHQLSILEAAFWQDLFAGKSIGEAFYNHGKGAYFNPLHLFGDPSLVIFSKN